jgi:ankyrin repeat protein
VKESIINARDGFKNTPLHEAALCGDLAAVVWLVQHGAEINARDMVGASALHRAAGEGHTDVACFLVNEIGVDANVKDNSDRTSIYYAAREGHLEVMKCLAQLGADVHAKDDVGFTALTCLLARPIIGDARDRLECFKWFVNEKDMDLTVEDSSGRTILYTMILLGLFRSVKWLVEEGKMDIQRKGPDGSTALHEAAARWDLGDRGLEIVKWLLEETDVKVDVKDDMGSTALHVAATGLSTKTNLRFVRVTAVEMMKLLIEVGKADVHAKNNKGESVLEVAEKSEDPDALQYVAGLRALYP